MKFVCAVLIHLPCCSCKHAHMAMAMATTMATVTAKLCGTQLTIFTTANLRRKANNSPNEIPVEKQSTQKKQEKYAEIESGDTKTIRRECQSVGGTDVIVIYAYSIYIFLFYKFHYVLSHIYFINCGKMYRMIWSRKKQRPVGFIKIYQIFHTYMYV